MCLMGAATVGAGRAEQPAAAFGGTRDRDLDSNSTKSSKLSGFGVESGPGGSPATPSLTTVSKKTAENKNVSRIFEVNTVIRSDPSMNMNSWQKCSSSTAFIGTIKHELDNASDRSQSAAPRCLSRLHVRPGGVNRTLFRPPPPTTIALSARTHRGESLAYTAHTPQKDILLCGDDWWGPRIQPRSP